MTSFKLTSFKMTSRCINRSKSKSPPCPRKEHGDKDGARIIKGRPFRVGCGWCEKQQPADDAVGAGDAGGCDSGLYSWDARPAACDLRGRNAFGVALRCAGAACGQAGGVQSAEERAVEVWEQERCHRCAEAGGVVAGGDAVAGVSRGDERAAGAAGGAQLYPADRRHDASDGAAEGGVSRPGGELRGQEAVWAAASGAVSGAVGPERSAAAGRAFVFGT